MRTYILKRKLKLLVALFITFIASCLAFMFTFKVNKVNADETFTMVEGAEIYIGKDASNEEEIVSGIKFSAKVPVDIKDEDFSVLIIHKEMLSANDKMTGNEADINVNGDVAGQLMTNYGISEADFANKFTVIKRPAVYKAQSVNFPEAGYYVYGSMIGLPENVFERDFVGFVYYTDAQDERVYAALPASGIDGVTRSILQVTNLALSKDFDALYNQGYTDALLSYTKAFGNEGVAYASAFYNMKDFSQYYATKTEVEVVPYNNNTYTGEVKTTLEAKTISEISYYVSTTSTGSINSPIEGTNDYLVKNTLLPTGGTQQVPAAMPFYFDSSDARYTLPESLRTQLKTLLDEGSSVAFSFYIYNAFGGDIAVYNKNETGSYIRNGKLLARVATDSWQLIELPLENITLGDTPETDVYKFGVGIEGIVPSEGNFVYKDVVDGENTISSKHIFFTDEIGFVKRIKLNGASETFFNSFKGWSTATVTREITTESNYMYNNSDYALKVDVQTTNRFNFELGRIQSADGCSVTDWSNAVLTADIYNENTFDLEIGLYFVSTANGEAAWTNDGLTEGSWVQVKTLKAGEWTTVAWSFRALGVGSNIFDDKVEIRLNSRHSNSSYKWSLAISNLDIVDYSAEKFPDLTTYYGTYKKNEVNMNVGFTANSVATITFDYLIVSGGDTLNITLRKDDITDNIYGAFSFDANGEKADYDGITTTKLATGYIRVVINLSELSKEKNVTGTPPDISVLNKLNFARWSGPCYYGNVRFT